MNINLDISGSKDVIYVDEQDTSTSIVFYIKDNGSAVDLTGLTLSFVLHRTSYIVAPLTITSASSGIATLTLTSAMTASPGTLAFEVVGMESDDTPEFDISSYMVVQKVYSGSDGQNDPDEENPGIDVLYGEDAPDDETDGEDKDFYLKLGIETTNILSLDKFHNENSTEQNPIYITDFTATSRDEYSFVIHGCPDNQGHGEWCYFELDGLVEGNTYELSFKMKFNSGATFPWPYNDYVETCGTAINFARDTNEHEYSCTFTYVAEGVMLFNFPRINDNVNFTATITEMKIVGDFVANQIDEIYNKYEDKWRKYVPAVMQGATSSADGTQGSVPQPTIADREKYLRGDGTWQDAQGASAVSDLTDVELTNLADKEILEWDAVAEKWKNVANSGGGGGAGGSSVYSEKQLYKASADSFQNISVTWDWEEYDAYIFNAHDTCLTTSYKQNGDSTILSKAQIKNLIDTDLTQYFYRGANQTTYKFSANAMTAMNNSGGYFVTEIVGLKFGTLSPIIYSEEEREIGVWIDNKPLYAKSFTLSSQITVSASSWTNTSLAIANVEKFINGYAISSDGTFQGSVAVDKNNDIIYLQSTRSSASYVTYLTVFYTKTTDVAGSGSYNTLGVPTVHYSTDEQVIGTWTDGKPLYERSFFVSSPTANTTTIIQDASFSNIKYVVKTQGVYQRATSGYIVFDTIGSYENSNYSSFCRVVKVSPNASEVGLAYYIKIATGNTISNLCMTIQYTKTTD